MRTEIELKHALGKVGEEVKSVLADDSMTAAEKGERLDKIQAHADELGAELKTIGQARRLMALGEAPGEAQEPQQKAAPRGIGEAIVAEKAYELAKAATNPFSRKTFHTGFEIGTKAQGAPSMMGEGTSGTTAPTAATGLFLAGSAGPSILPNFLPGIVPQLFYPLQLMSLFPQGTTDSPVVSWVQETAWTNNAAAVPEGASKPYSSDTIARQQEQVGKIANLLKLTDEMMQDAPAFASFVQNRLVQGVQRQEEVQVLAGTGYPGVNGLLNHSQGFTVAVGGSQTTAANVSFPASGTAGAGTSGSTISTIYYGRAIGTTGSALNPVSVADGLYGAMTDLRTVAFVEPDAIVMNPQNWAQIRLAKDGQGQYLGGSFFGADYGTGANAGESLWGKRVVVTPAMPVDTVLIGSFGEATQVFRRQGITVDMSNSNGTDFEQNLVTVRAESRVALATYRPPAFELIHLLHS